MSYILDALRRADAERSRGAVPGLHAQGVPADLEPAARDYRPLIWAAGGAGALLVAVIVILVMAPWKSGSAPAESRAAFAPAPDLAPTPRDAAAAAAPAQMAPGELPASQPGAIEPGARPVEPPIGRGNPPAAPSADARAPQPYPPPPQAVRAARENERASARDTLADRAAEGRVATLEPRAAAHLPAATPAPSRTPPQAGGASPSAAPVEHYGPPIAATPAPAAARGNAVPNIKDLAPDVRSQLPRLAVAGSVYSETPSARMVILNGQVFHEGEKPAPDTVLEQIRLKSAILNFRGQRYEITF
ncbi:MAG: general secretion pathway protein GspB [Burkholderiaceae bacterium]